MRKRRDGMLICKMVGSRIRSLSRFPAGSRATTKRWDGPHNKELGWTGLKGMVPPTPVGAIFRKPSSTRPHFQFRLKIGRTQAVRTETEEPDLAIEENIS